MQRRFSHNASKHSVAEPLVWDGKEREYHTSLLAYEREAAREREVPQPQPSSRLHPWPRLKTVMLAGQVGPGPPRKREGHDGGKPRETARHWGKGLSPSRRV